MKGFKAVILAGGSGERFWPLSTPERPKQFLSVFGGESLIRQSVSRLGGLAGPEDTFVVTSHALAAATVAELPELDRSHVVGEPMRRDTGPAVALGVGIAAPEGDPVVGFFPSDHLIGSPARFRATLRKAIALARKGKSIVVIGIMPSYPATAFGYVDPEKGRFVEKPDLAKAKRYLKAGYLWNAGMFIARASVFRRALELCAPALAGLAAPGGVSVRALGAAYEPLPRISFDYAVMEHVSRGVGGLGVAVVPGDFGWDDVGGYGAFDKYYPHDADGNVREGECRAVDSSGNICVARAASISLVGVKNLVVVTTRDAVLVADKSHLSEMKRLFK